MNDAGGSDVPQLWKCGPEISGNFETCDPGDCSLVAESGFTGKTDFGDSNNKYITMLIVNGNYLYVGFDNAVAGVEIGRSKKDDLES